MPISDRLDPKVLAILVGGVGLEEQWLGELEVLHELVVRRMELERHEGQSVDRDHLEVGTENRIAVEEDSDIDQESSADRERELGNLGFAGRHYSLADLGMENLAVEVVDHSRNCCGKEVDRSFVAEEDTTSRELEKNDQHVVKARHQDGTARWRQR